MNITIKHILFMFSILLLIFSSCGKGEFENGELSSHDYLLVDGSVFNQTQLKTSLIAKTEAQKGEHSDITFDISDGKIINSYLNYKYIGKFGKAYSRSEYFYKDNILTYSITDNTDTVFYRFDENGTIISTLDLFLTSLTTDLGTRSIFTWDSFQYNNENDLTKSFVKDSATLISPSGFKNVYYIDNHTIYEYQSDHITSRINYSNNSEKDSYEFVYDDNLLKEIYRKFNDGYSYIDIYNYNADNTIANYTILSNGDYGDTAYITNYYYTDSYVEEISYSGSLKHTPSSQKKYGLNYELIEYCDIRMGSSFDEINVYRIQLSDGKAIKVSVETGRNINQLELTGYFIVKERNAEGNMTEVDIYNSDEQKMFVANIDKGGITLYDLEGLETDIWTQDFWIAVLLYRYSDL